MHLNYHFLQYLCPELAAEFRGKTIQSCFSQSKDELLIETSDVTETRWIRAHLLPPQIYLSYPTQFNRAKRNSINLFDSIVGDKILDCKVFQFERAFFFSLESGQTLVFKLHGNRSNILLFGDIAEPPTLLFRNEILEDKTLLFNSLQNPLDLSKSRFVELAGNASKFLPTLGTIPRNWLKERGYPDADLETKWSLMEQLLDLLETPLFTLVNQHEEVLLSLLPEPNPIKTFSSPLEATNELFYLALVKGSFEKEKNSLLRSLQDQLKRTLNYLEKSRQKLIDLRNSPPPSQLADVIMANLHAFSPGVLELELLNFYSGEPIKVSLKPNQKPQEFAENLYRKSKNRQLEIDQLEKTLEAKEVFKTELLQKIEALDAIQDFKSLKAYQKSQPKTDKSTQKTSGLPFKVFDYEGYTIWVGKSAKDNDEMLRGFVHKDDLWLHARQAAGSHVIIRTKGMPKVPKQVIERAGGLAAFYSKLKSDTLAPVILTEAKYVRKVKGSAPGSVMVDREKVIMVIPKGPDDQIAT